MQEKKKEIITYIAEHVNMFIEPMVYAIVKKRPADPLSFALKWLGEHASKQKQQAEATDSDEEDDIIHQAEIDARIRKSRTQSKQHSRIGISSEVFGLLNKQEDFCLKNVQKSEETKLLIKSLIRNSILFQNMDRNDEEVLINAMEEKDTTEEQIIIREGEAGDVLYIVESGSYECFKNIQGSEKYLKTYQHGEAFGELALMYNAPRAATIITKSSGKLYLLDRNTFNYVVKSATTRKRTLFKNTIDRIELFSDLNSLEKEQFYDVLKEEKYEAGQYIIKQGDQGNKFYIVIEGNLVAEKKEANDEFPKIVYKYREGEYFGELALIHDLNRQASVKALTSVRVASICRESFKRILGNLQDILKRNEERYQNVQGLICA